MKFERTIFFVTLFICIGAVATIYLYREKMALPAVPTIVSQSNNQSEANETLADTEVETNATDGSNSNSAIDTELDLDPLSSNENGDPRDSTEETIASIQSSDENFATVIDANLPEESPNESVNEATEIADNLADSREPLDDDSETQQAEPEQQIVFDDELIGDWQNWSWDTTVDFANASPVEEGQTSIAVTYDKSWGALWLSATESVSRKDYDILRFWIHGGSAGAQSTRVSLADGNQMLLDKSVDIVAKAGTWSQVDIPLAELEATNEIGGIVWQDGLGKNQPPFFIDHISFVKSDSVAAVDSMPVTPVSASNSVEISEGAALAIDVNANRRPINPDIYGINYADESLIREIRIPVRRWGGNAATRYNWQLDVSNRASDWFFETIAEEVDDVALLPNGSSADVFVAQNQANGAKTILTMPLMGWTPKSREFSCSFPVSKYGEQQSIDQWNPDCGNGIAPNGEALTADPNETNMPIDATFVSEWINHLVDNFGSASDGGVAYYSLDNEPMLWHYTHRDIHPEPVSYDELYERTIEYALAIKEADPSAMTLGPAVWGWTAYFYSALDQDGGGLLNQNSDRAAHDDLPLLAWYLRQMNDYEQRNGTRLLDYLDVHYYPQAQNVALAPAGNANTQALRLRSTRSLWDDTYIDESWINEPVRLIPRLREWIDEYYPGTKLSLSEYNWGALDDINGALAQAELLGIFGREGVDLATLWDPLDVNDPFAFAFRLFRNYDNNGGEFGDISVLAENLGQTQLSAYAAQRTADEALTIIVINPSNDAVDSTITIENFIPVGPVQVFRYSNKNITSIVSLPDVEIQTSQFTDLFPENSLTLYVIRNAEAR